MPRQAHGRPVSAAAGSSSSLTTKNPKKRKAPVSKNRGLNALQIAEKEGLDGYEDKIRKHRLGEDEDDDGGDERGGKRRRVGDEDGDLGGGSDGDEGVDGERWHVMGSGDEGEGEEDEDSEIESDDAFGESDEEKFVGFAFRGSKNNQKRRGVEDGDEEEDEGGDEDDEESLGEEAVDLATAWDMDDADEVEEQERKVAKKRRRGESDAEEMHNGSATSEDENEDDSEEDDQSDLSVSEAEDGDHERLQDFVQSLSKKPEASKPSSSAPKSTKISASDLLQYIKDPVQRQSLKILQSNERTGPEVYKGGIPGRLAAPLAKRQQDRLDRSAAYDESKKTLGKWVDTVKQNRRAEHLSFPLVDPNDSVETASKQLASTQGKPMNNLERKVQEIMIENGMIKEGGKPDDELSKENEELEEQKVSYEEVQARRAELRKQRDLMFREEVRARRIKKIKSKAYRRVHRKERAKQELEQRAEDAANGVLDSENDREKNDRRRAEERMGRRHRESKWAKGMKEAGRAKWDEGTRGAMEEAARRDEELRRRIEGRDDDEDSLDERNGESDGYSSNEEGVALHEKLARLSKEGTTGPSSKLGGMAFMQREEAAKRIANDAAIFDIRKQLRAENEVQMDLDAEDAEPLGRQTYGAKADKSTKPPTRKPLESSEFEEKMSGDELSGPEAEPDVRVAVSQQSKKVEIPVNGSTSTALPLARRNLQQKSSTNDQPRKQLMKPSKVPETALDEYTSPSDSENEDQSAALEGLGPVSLADDIFAGSDTIVKDFQKEKEQIVKEEGDQIVDGGLPGWGSWTGVGISKKAQNRQKNKFLTTIKGVAPEKRQDSKLDKVIINEKRVKKNGKYLATELPHPFESRQQYERSLRLPLGPEWTTKSTFQDATKPRVLIKQGVIRPMARPQA